MTKRVYGEKEVSELLRRTAELQKQSANPTGAGLTLDELEIVAAEAGLDPRLLRAAAAELKHKPEGKPALMLSSDKTSTHNLVDRWISGPISEEAWDDLVAMLRYRFDTDLGRAMGMPNYGSSSAETNGRTFEWRHTSMSGVETRLLLRPAGEGHRMQMSQRVGWGSIGAESGTYGFLIASLIGFVAGAVTSAALIGVGVLLLSLVASFAMVYSLDKSWREKKGRELEALADKIIDTIGPNHHEVSRQDPTDVEALPPQPYGSVLVPDSGVTQTKNEVMPEGQSQDLLRDQPDHGEADSQATGPRERRRG